MGVQVFLPGPEPLVALTAGPEALADAIQHMRAGTPLIVRDEKDGSRAVLWAPGDED